MTLARLLVSLTGLLLGLAAPLAAQNRPSEAQPTFVRGVALDRAGSTKGSLYLRDGAIVAVLDGAAPAPAGTRVIEGEGLICLPAFLDAWSRQGSSVTPPVKDQDLPPNEQANVAIDMRLANRKGIQPSFRAVRALALTKELTEGWQKSGFGAALIAPGGELLSGTSTLVALREAAMRDLVLREDVFAHAAFAASGPGYPSTLMGHFAQLRQFFLDSQRQLELARRHADGRPGPRPPFDAELAAGAELVRGERRLLCEAEGMEDFGRWVRLAREFGLELGFVGGREAWRAGVELDGTGRPLVLTLDWGKEIEDPRPKEEKKEAAEVAGAEATVEAPVAPEEAQPEEPVWTYLEPDEVRLERRRLWEEKRDNALRLHERGVPFVFGTGARKPSELLTGVRTLVKQGLPAEVALRALTQGAAELLGVERRLGSIAAGKDATFVLWRADPLLDEKASVAWSFVDGHAREFPEEKKKEKKEGAKPGEGLEVSGTWALTFEVQGEGVKEATLALKLGEAGAVEGTISLENPMGGGRLEAPVEGTLDGDELELEFTLEFGEFRLETALEATLEGDTLEGETEFTMPGMEESMSQAFTGRRQPE